MTVDFQIDKNETREPYMIKTWKGNELKSEKPAKILAYYDVKILKTGKISVFDITELDNENAEMLDHDDTIYEHLSELGLEKSKIEYLIGELIANVQQLYFEQKSNSKLEMELK